MKLILIISTLISSSLASYGAVRIRGGGVRGKLELQLANGDWGGVCYYGFNSEAAKVACKQLGYDDGTHQKAYGDYYHSSESSKDIDICRVDCHGYESSLADCDISECGHYNSECVYNWDYVIISCSYDHYHDYYNTDSSSSSGGGGGSSTGTIIGAAIGSLIIFGMVFFIVACRVYVRYSYIRRNQNRRFIVIQRRTPRRILIARVTRTFSSGPPPPPAYTPSDPNTGYTPVQPRAYQPVATTDYVPVEPTNTPSVPPDNIPSDPPPSYTPTVSTNVSVPIHSVTDDSAQ